MGYKHDLGAGRLFDLCHEDAASAGWWGDDTGEGFPTDAIEVASGTRLGNALVAQKLALVHSEVSEALEGHRKNLMDDHLPHRSMFEVELADAIIRIADLAGAMGCDLEAAIQEKLAYNRERADHKPEARAGVGGKVY